VVTPVVSVVDVHTLSIKNSASAVSASAKWHTAANFLASRKRLGNYPPTINYEIGPTKHVMD